MNTLTNTHTKWLRLLPGLGLILLSAGAAHAQIPSSPNIVWTGAVDVIYTRPGNWNLGRVPNSTDFVSIPVTGNGRQPVLDATLGIGAAGNLVVNSGASLTLLAQSELDLFGDLQNNGTFGGSGLLSVRSLTAVGASTPTLTTHNINGSGSTSTITLSDLETLTNAPTTLNVPVRLSRLLALTSNVTTTAAGTLTLLSTPSVTAFVINNGTAVVSGTATVQRAIDASLNAGTGYRHYSSPVSNTTVADLSTASYTPDISQAANYNTSPTPPLVRPFPQLYYYDQAQVNRNNSSPNFDKGFVVPLSTSDPLLVGRGYTMNIPGNQLVDFVGALNNGDISVTVSRNAAGTLNSGDAGWQFLGNPYPAPLDYSKVLAADRAGLDNSIYVYSSTAQYDGIYRAYTNGVGGSSGNPIIPVGQAFFARVTTPGTTSTFNFRNTQRLTTSDATTFQRTAADKRPQLELALNNDNKAMQDVLNVYFENGSTAGVDAQYDAVKMVNTNGMMLSTSTADGQKLAIDGRPAPTEQLTIPLNLAVAASGTYTLQAAKLVNMTDLHVYLHDMRLGSVTDLAQQPDYTFNMSSGSTAARFELIFSARAIETVAPAALTQQVDVYPSPAKGTAFIGLPASLGNEAITATLVDALGRTVRTSSLPAQGEATHQFSLDGLRGGIYVLRLHTSAGIVAKRLAVE